MMPKKTYPFAKSPKWNIFDTYNDSDTYKKKIRSEQANIEMKNLCDRFIMDFTKISNKYSNIGLSDSASRDMVLRYLLEKIEPWRKTKRIRAEKGLGKLPDRR